MTAARLYDLARMTVSGAPGTGTMTLAVAVPSFLTFAQAGVQNGEIIRYSIRDGMQRETGFGTYQSAGPTLTRNVRKSTNGDALLNLSAGAVVAIVETSEDILSFATDQRALFTDAERAVARLNLGVKDPLAPSQGRLTLASGTPVMTTSQAAKTTLFWTPYVGDKAPIFDGTSMAMTTCGELSVLTTDATKNPAPIGASKVNDWFIWNDAGTVRLSHGPDWTNNTTRSAGTALARVNGVLVNNVAITNGPAAQRGTYVGTTASAADSKLHWVFGGPASGGSPAQLLLWNMYNRALVSTYVLDGAASYTYGSGVVRAARANVVNTGVGMFVSYVMGIAEEPVIVHYVQRIDTVAIGNVAAISIGHDTTASFSQARTFVLGAIANQPHKISNHAEFNGDLGLHYVAGEESSDVGVATFNADVDSTFFANFHA